MIPVLIVLAILLFFVILLDYNPFYKSISVPDTIIDHFSGGSGLGLYDNTHLYNPLINTNVPKKKIRHKNMVLVVTDTNVLIEKSVLYDIVIVYTGDDNSAFELLSNKYGHTFRNKGSKYQNLHFLYRKHPDVVNKYNRFLIIDNTVTIDKHSINTLFKMVKRYNLWIATANTANTANTETKELKLLYTNFIDKTMPVFNKNALDMFMQFYNPILDSFGVDYLYMWACGTSNKHIYAIIDGIPYKNIDMEINKDMIQPIDDSSWKKIKKKYNIDMYDKQIWTTRVIKI